MQKTIDTLRPFMRDEKFLWRANAGNLQAKKSPQNARFIMSTLGSKNPTYYQASLFGPTKARPLKEEIQRYMDYEN
jgi:hypothetical protein